MVKKTDMLDEKRANLLLQTQARTLVGDLYDKFGE
jgi:hypothetical protein